MIEAKKEGVTLTGVETASDKYTRGLPAGFPLTPARARPRRHPDKIRTVLHLKNKLSSDLLGRIEVTKALILAKGKECS